MSAQQKLELSDDKQLLDVEMIHQFLSTESGWATGISLERTAVALENSLCIGAYLKERQIGLVRVVTDYATYANLCDIFVVPTYRNNGIAQAMLRFTLNHPHLQGLRRITLVSPDAQGLYQKVGFRPLHNPQSHLEIFTPNAYQN